RGPLRLCHRRRRHVHVSSAGNQHWHIPDAAVFRGRNVRPQRSRTKRSRKARDHQAMKRSCKVGLRPAFGFIAVLALLTLRFWPHAKLSDQVNLSTSIWSADGQLLRVTLAQDDTYRLWTPLDKISKPLIEAFLLKEDRSFYWH